MSNNRIDIVKVITLHHEDIKNGTYEWKEEELLSIKRMALYIIRENMRLTYDVDNKELLNHILTNFFSVIKRMYIEPNRERGFPSSYIYDTMKYSMLSYLKKIAIINEHEIKSLDKNVSNHKDKENTPLIDLIKSDTLNAYEAMEAGIIKDYYFFLNKQINNFHLLKEYYLDKKTKKQIAFENNITEDIIGNVMKKEENIIKILCIQNGFNSNIIYNKNFDETKEYVEKCINKYGLLYTMYNMNNSLEDLATYLNMDVSSLNCAADYILKEKEIEMVKKGVSEAKKYLKFTKMYFPKLSYKVENLDKSYFTFVDAVVDSNVILKEYFKEDKSLKDIAKNINRSELFVNLVFSSNKKSINKAYKMYKENNCYLEDYVIEDVFNYYDMFAMYYLSDNINEVKNRDERVLRFIDEIINNNEFLFKYYKEHKSYLDISKEMNKTLKTIRINMEKLKDEIPALYKVYIGNDYNLDILYSYDYRYKFAKYFFPQILDEVKNRNEIHIKFIDRIIDSNIIYVKYYKEGYSLSETMDMLNLKNKRSIYGNKEKLQILYKMYVNSGYDIDRTFIYFNYLKFCEKVIPSESIHLIEMDEEYFNLIDKIIDSNKLLFMYYKENMSIEEISKITNKSSEQIGKALSFQNKKARNIYLDDSKTSNLNNINDNYYVKFAKWCLPEIVKNVSNKDKKYLDFIDEMINRNKYLVLRFKEDKDGGEIARLINRQTSFVSSIMFQQKKRILSDFEKYIESNYDIGVVRDKYRNRRNFHDNCYVKFIKFYLPNEIDKSDNVEMIEFIDKIFEHDIYFDEYFKDKKGLKEISMEINYSAYNYFKNKKNMIRKLYDNTFNYNYYDKFIAYYHLDSEMIKNNKHMLNMIDEIIDSNVLLIKYFKENKSSDIISDELNRKRRYVCRDLNSTRESIKKMFDENKNNISRV